MATIAFDTLKFARALREKAHLSAEQAEGFAEAVTDALHDDLATKADVNAVKADLSAVKGELKADVTAAKTELKAEIANLRSEIAAVRADLRSEIVSVRSEIELGKRDLKIWFGSIMVVAVGVILIAIRYLPAGHP